jgi:hypothetical protein
MTATLRQIVRDAAAECRIPRPSTVFNNNDEQVQELLSLSNRGGRQLAKDVDWTVLQKLHTVTTSAANTTGEYSLPDDYSRLIGETYWDRSANRPMAGAVNPQQWQSFKSGVFGEGVVTNYFRIYRASTGVGRSLWIHPVPTVDGDELVWEYISGHWCATSDGSTTQDEWGADTDIAILDRDLMTLDLIVRWKRQNGLDFASEADELMLMVSRDKGQDRPSPDLNLVARQRIRLLDGNNIPESGYGG